MSDSYVKISSMLIPYFKDLITHHIHALECEAIETYKREQKEYYSLPFYRRMFKFEPYYVGSVKDRINHWRWVLEDISVDTDVYVEVWTYKQLKELERKYESTTNSENCKGI